MGNRIRFWQWRTASGQMKLRIKSYLYGFILKLMGYGQSLFRIPVSACILRKTQLSQFYSMQKYHTFWRPVNFADMLVCILVSRSKPVIKRQDRCNPNNENNNNYWKCAFRWLMKGIYLYIFICLYLLLFFTKIRIPSEWCFFIYIYL